MVVEYTRYKIDDRRASAFIDAQRRATRYFHLRCFRYELTRCSEEPHWYTLRTEWQSREQLQHFYNGPAGEAFRHAMDGFACDLQEQRHWESTDIAQSGVGLTGVKDGCGVLIDRYPWNVLYAWILEQLPRRILVEQMAEQVNISPRNFARVFRRTFLVSPGEFLTRLRVAAAISDLAECMQTVEQIAATRDFGSSSTMRHTFLRTVGLTPSEYRQKLSASGPAAPTPMAHNWIGLGPQSLIASPDSVS